jgi:hypothetical protein
MAEGSFSWPFWLLILTFDIDAVTGIDVMAVDGLMLMLSLYSQVSHTLINIRIVVDRLTFFPHVLFRIKIASRPTPSSLLRIPPKA